MDKLTPKQEFLEKLKAKKIVLDNKRPWNTMRKINYVIKNAYSSKSKT